MTVAAADTHSCVFIDDTYHHILLDTLDPSIMAAQPPPPLPPPPPPPAAPVAVITGAADGNLLDVHATTIAACRQAMIVAAAALANHDGSNEVNLVKSPSATCICTAAARMDIKKMSAPAERLLPLSLSPGWTAMGSNEYGSWSPPTVHRTRPTSPSSVLHTVHLSGVVCGPSSLQWNQTNIIAVLPNGYRPLHTHIFTCDGESQYARVDVTPNGEVQLIRGHGGYLSLDTISFIAVIAANIIAAEEATDDTRTRVRYPAPYDVCHCTRVSPAVTVSPPSTCTRVAPNYRVLSNDVWSWIVSYLPLNELFAGNHLALHARASAIPLCASCRCPLVALSIQWIDISVYNRCIWIESFLL